MAKYSIGDVLRPKIDCQGFNEITIGDIRGDRYLCKIINGTATIRCEIVDNNYELVKKE